ncbi:MAG: AraC family transcriptional regulator [Ruminococcaceae bacterium]|nr:AraC family transcriptional regulator [Oscillospiraceae bacterium]
MKSGCVLRSVAGTDLSIEEISHAVGISDTSYFSRIFKKHCGVTPTQYRAEFNRI